MTKEERIQRSIEKVKAKLLKNLETSPSMIRECYSFSQNEFEDGLVDIMIDTSFNIKSKKELKMDTINLKH